MNFFFVSDCFHQNYSLTSLLAIGSKSVQNKYLGGERDHLFSVWVLFIYKMYVLKNIKVCLLSVWLP